MSRARRLAGWLPHLCLGLLALLEVGAWSRAHQSMQELREVWSSGELQERAFALHVLTNRGEPDPDDFDPAFVRGLLAQDSLRLRELAFSYDLTKIRPPKIQSNYIGDQLEEAKTRLAAGDDELMTHLVLCYLVQGRKVGGPRVGGGPKLQRVELGWYLDALAGRDLPFDEIWAHVGARKVTMASRRGFYLEDGELHNVNDGSDD